MLANIRTSRAIQAFIDRWREQLQEAEVVFKDTRSANVIRVFLEELEAMRAAELAVELTVQEAADVSGYHESSIWRMLGDGELEDVGEPGSPRILATDLPLKVDRNRSSEGPARTVEFRHDEAPRLGTARLEMIND